MILAIWKLVGEGFDHPALDTLVLAMPVSWKGTLQQYAGRLHREEASKADVRIIDFIDAGHPALLWMWSKRQRGYKAMGYRLVESSSAMSCSARKMAVESLPSSILSYARRSTSRLMMGVEDLWLTLLKMGSQKALRGAIGSPLIIDACFVFLV